jgi:hypothetical protein
LPWAKPAIAFQVEGEALEEPHHVAQPVALPFEHFDLVVQSFDKAAGLAVDEVVRNQSQPNKLSVIRQLAMHIVAIVPTMLPGTLVEL